jgi:hypothetical protein
MKTLNMNLHFGQWLKWLRALSHIAKIPAYFRGYSKGISNQDCKALSKSEAFHTILIKPFGDWDEKCNLLL